MNLFHNKDAVMFLVLAGMMATGIVIAVVGLVTSALASPKRD